jgi:hypothetical protein
MLVIEYNMVTSVIGTPIKLVTKFYVIPDIVESVVKH